MRRRVVLLAFAVGLQVGVAPALVAGCGDETSGAPTGGETGAPPSDSPSDAILFTRWASAGERTQAAPRHPPSLYVVEPDGSGLRLLADDAADAAVSPDGREVAFVRDGSLWLIRTNGTGERRLTKAEGSSEQRVPGQNATSDAGPGWSPDGRTVYFSRVDWNAATESIWSVRTDGSRLNRLKEAAKDTGTAGYGEAYFDPAPAPDGQTVAFSYTSDFGHGQDTHIAAMTPHGEDAHLPFEFPTATDGLDPLTFDPAWSPDGQLLAYGLLDAAASVEGRPGASGLYVSQRGRSAPRRVGAPQADVSSPAWSRDGKWIVFASGRNDRGDIWVARADGTGVRQVTRTKEDERDPVWLPARP